MSAYLRRMHEELTQIVWSRQFVSDYTECSTQIPTINELQEVLRRVVLDIQRRWLKKICDKQAYYAMQILVSGYLHRRWRPIWHR